MLFARTGRALVPTLRNPLISTSSLVARLPPLGPRFGGVGLRLNVGPGCGSRLLIGVGRQIAWSADTSLSTRSVRSAIRPRRLCGIYSWIALSPNRSFMRSSLKQARSVAYPALRRTSRSGFPSALLGFVARSRRFSRSSTSLWRIWRLRNDCVFEGARPVAARLAEDILGEADLWRATGAQALERLPLHSRPPD